LHSLLIAVLLCCIVVWNGVSANAAAPDRDRHVVVICVDGLPAYLFDDPNAPLPTIRALAARGVVADGMKVSNPSVTWPNHTSLTTGVRPDRHGVLFNGVLERTGPGLPVKVDPRKDKTELVHVPTIYDVLYERGLTTAAINWPCTRNAPTIQDNFPDVPEALDHTTPRLLEGLKLAGGVKDVDLQGFLKLSSPARDRIWTQAVCHVIRERKPNLVLFHLLNVDGVHHRYGPLTPAGYTAVAYADTCVREVVDAIDAAGIRDRTSILIVADHGFLAIPQTLQPNVVLRQADLLTVEGNQIATARAHVIPEGGIGMLYLTVPGSTESDREKVVELFREREGIAEILRPQDFARYGLPQPDEYPQMADLILVAKDGYGFSGAAVGDEFVVKSDVTVGTHGFLSTNPRMNAIFVASGAGIRNGGKLAAVENIDVAPTIARLLNVPFPMATGRVLVNALDEMTTGTSR